MGEQRQRDPFVVKDYEVMIDAKGFCYAKVTWRCTLCDKEFVMYDPPKAHLNECLAYLVNKI